MRSVLEQFKRFIWHPPIQRAHCWEIVLNKLCLSSFYSTMLLDNMLNNLMSLMVGFSFVITDLSSGSEAQWVRNNGDEWKQKRIYWVRMHIFITLFLCTCVCVQVCMHGVWGQCHIFLNHLKKNGVNQWTWSSLVQLGSLASVLHGHAISTSLQKDTPLCMACFVCFTWVLGTRSRVLKFAQEAFKQLSHLPSACNVHF